jgi:hypothetical protein
MTMARFVWAISLLLLIALSLVLAAALYYWPS